jgi:acyl dehydratase
LRIVLRWIAVAVAAGIIALTIGSAASAGETAVGVGAGVAVEDTSIDAEFVQYLQSTLDSQFVGVDVALVRGRLILEGFATPGVHTAVLAIVANLLGTPVPVPVALGLITPDLGLDLPFLALGAGIEIPNLGGLIRTLGVVDRIQIIR